MNNPAGERKVYCKDCKHFSFSYHAAGYDPCVFREYYTDSVTGMEKYELGLSVRKNKDNNCPDFKKKLTLWEKIKRWIV